MRMPVDTQVIEGSHMRATFLLGLPSLGTVSTKFVVAFSRLQMPVNCAANSMVVERMEVGVARSYIAEQYLKMDPRPRYLFFLGDDMLPPWDGLVRLWEEMETGRWDILSGLYYLKSEPPSPLMRRVGITGPLLPDVHWKPGDVVPVDICGMDFVLIRPEVFEAITTPYFKTGFEFTPTDLNGNGNIGMHTEDTYFLKKVREHKFRIGVHTGVRVGHFDAKSGMIY